MPFVRNEVTAFSNSRFTIQVRFPPISPPIRDSVPRFESPFNPSSIPFVYPLPARLQSSSPRLSLAARACCCVFRRARVEGPPRSADALDDLGEVFLTMGPYRRRRSMEGEDIAEPMVADVWLLAGWLGGWVGLCKFHSGRDRQRCVDKDEKMRR
ncbi:hypothetical protein MBM_04266 [Drepanopeziza brunnea f. sp. 'multigermtubi' MB_m1]|uniref:Uncharacterized protein n=1 Tax=Marssonina brunnea f. sp. multigermtubi (strain MB_m1) TaxID=1072389 RepID=K1WID2_MARBU|nr:uncharacterized protein MBM_04266 [Drepanopeziza brunnea f. sp. 'multigermtubi' MB_m1]EKD17405.1 hypothetical protein MBM_04266 [Drepanopeziza brunnea f. sp. 'multigermtubi' MB_m1]